MSDHTPQSDDPNAAAEALTGPREKPMGFWEHLEELRGTIIKSLIVFLICATVLGYFLKEFSDALQWPLLHVAKDFPSLDVKLTTLSIMEVFNMIIQMCVFGGLMLASPFILYFIAQFVAPALTEKELKLVVPLCVSALILFLIGAAFSFFLLMPSTIRIAIQLNESLNFKNQWTAGNYYTTLTWLVLGSGGVFEFPLVIVLLVWIGVLTTAFLRRYRRHAIVVIFIIAAVVTPTPDPINQSLFAGPLYLLYEIAILVSSRIEKRRERLRKIG